jgi:hypothetical protein
MREIRTSGSMSGVWKRNDGRRKISGTVKAKLTDTEIPNRCHRTTSRLYEWVLIEIFLKPAEYIAKFVRPVKWLWLLLPGPG